MLDSSAGVTVISQVFWHTDWKLITPLNSLTGIGGAILCLQSEYTITVTGLEGKIAAIHPLILQ